MVKSSGITCSCPYTLYPEETNVSFFILEPELLSFFKKDVFQDFGKDIFPKMISERITLKGYLTNDYLIDIGTLENLKKAGKDLKFYEKTPI